MDVHVHSRWSEQVRKLLCSHFGAMTWKMLYFLSTAAMCLLAFRNEPWWPQQLGGEGAEEQLWQGGLHERNVQINCFLVPTLGCWMLPHSEICSSDAFCAAARLSPVSELSSVCNLHRCDWMYTQGIQCNRTACTATYTSTSLSATIWRR